MWATTRNKSRERDESEQSLSVFVKTEDEI